MQRNTNIGRQLGRYKIIEEIGQGGMAVVYRALDTKLNREVALKLLHPHLCSHVESRRRFRREARAVARLKHPSILETYDYSDEEGKDIFLVMELVHGTTLRQLLDNQWGKPLPGEVVTMILRQVSAALAHVHESGVVHRDIKPENILMGPTGETKLSDFGIAHLAQLSQMTVTGQILGSPAYMSPEHIEKADPDARADIFSIGTVLYEAATGRAPFEGHNPHAIIKKIVDGKFVRPLDANPKLAHLLGKTIEKCLAPNPNHRYQSARELLRDLDTVLEQMGITEISEELASYVANPETWCRNKLPGFLNRTLQLGLAASRSRRPTEAIDHFNRMLALDPGNSDALAALKQMGKQRRTNRILTSAAFALSIAIALAAILWVWTSNLGTGQEQVQVDETRNTGKTDGNQTDTRTASKPTAQNTRDAGIDTAKSPDPLQSKNSPIRRARAKRKILFTPNPMAVTIVIDGKKRFLFGPTNRAQLVTPGRHTISFIPNNAKRFVEQTWNINVPPGNKPFHFRGRLRWRPATLLVTTNADAVITIPGRASHAANSAFKVAVKDGPNEKITVLISADGYIPITKQVTITAGEQTVLGVDLTKRES